MYSSCSLRTTYVCLLPDRSNRAHLAILSTHASRCKPPARSSPHSARCLALHRPYLGESQSSHPYLPYLVVATEATLATHHCHERHMPARVSIPCQELRGFCGGASNHSNAPTQQRRKEKGETRFWLEAERSGPFAFSSPSLSLPKKRARSRWS